MKNIKMENLEKFICKRYRTYQGILEEFGWYPGLKNDLSELVKLNKIKFCNMYINKWQLIFAKPDFDFSTVGANKKVKKYFEKKETEISESASASPEIKNKVKPKKELSRRQYLFNLLGENKSEKEIMKLVKEKFPQLTDKQIKTSLAVCRSQLKKK